jgi:hypothetical protein
VSKDTRRRYGARFSIGTLVPLRVIPHHSSEQVRLLLYNLGRIFRSVSLPRRVGRSWRMHPPTQAVLSFSHGRHRAGRGGLLGRQRSTVSNDSGGLLSYRLRRTNRQSVFLFSRKRF